MSPPKHAPHVGVETIAPASTKRSSRPSASASPVDALRRRHDDRAAARVDASARGAPRPPGGGRSSSRSRSCRCRPGRSSCPAPRRPARRCPAGGGARRAARRPETSIREPLRELGVGVRALGRPRPVGPTLEVVGGHVVGREEARVRAGLDGHVRDREALVDRERRGAVADELERHVRGAADAELADDGEDQILAGDEAPLLAGELDPDRRRAPSARTRRTRGRRRCRSSRCRCRTRRARRTCRCASRRRR